MLFPADLLNLLVSTLPDLEGLVACNECGCGILRDDALLRGGDTYCGTCAFICYDCGAVCADADGIAIGSNVYCPDCVIRCDNCHDLEARRCARDVADGQSVCEACSSDYVFAEDTGEYHHQDDVVFLVDTREWVTTHYAERHCYCDDDGDWYAERPHDDGDSHPLSYGEDVRNHCVYDAAALAAGALMFGVELEMEPNSDATQAELVEALGGPVDEDRFILKEDGSLNDGVELVTVPLTLEDHRDRFGWSKVLSRVRRIARSGAGTTRCGMHVHINRKALTPLQIGKMLVFLNDPKMDHLITLVAQRSSTHYCERKAKKPTDVYRGCDRYEALNLTKRNTVEVRIFRGNLRPDRVLKNIEFCHALVVYCRDTSLREIADPQAFLKWMGSRKKDYPHLHDFLNEKGAFKCA